MDREKRLRCYKDGRRTPEEQAAYREGYNEGVRRVAVVVEHFLYQTRQEDCLEDKKWPSKRQVKAAMKADGA